MTNTPEFRIMRFASCDILEMPKTSIISIEIDIVIPRTWYAKWLLCGISGTEKSPYLCIIKQKKQKTEY